HISSWGGQPISEHPSPPYWRNTIILQAKDAKLRCGTARSRFPFMRQYCIVMHIDKPPVAIPCLPQSAFMLEAHFFKATPGRDIAPLNHCIHPMQVILGKGQRGELFDYHGTEPFVPIAHVTDDDPYFAASLRGVYMFKRTVADEHLVSVHRE